VDASLRRRVILAVSSALLGGGVVLVLMGNLVLGLALISAAWFARVAVRRWRRRDELERLIEGLSVGAVMETFPFVVAPQATLDTFAPALDGDGVATIARVMQGDDLLGLVGSREIDRVPRKRWASVRAAEAMVAYGEMPVLGPADALGPAVERLGALSGLPVVRDGSLAGILTRLAVGRTLHERAEARAERSESR